MMKQGDKVVVVRMETTQRLTTMDEKANDPDLGDFIIEKPKEVRRKGVLGSLHNLAVRVNLPDGDYRGCLYHDLTFLKSGKVSFESHKPDWKGVKKDKDGVYREKIIPGKVIRLVGKVILSGVYIPVTIEGKPCQIPFEQLKFEKESK